MEYSGAGGKLIHEKNQKQKISWHCPFKPAKLNFFKTPASEAEFLDEIQTKVLRIFLLAIHSHLYRFALRFFKHTQPLTVSVKEKAGKSDRKRYPLPYCLRNPFRNLKSENSQQYAQKPQWNCTFMNSASVHVLIPPFPVLKENKHCKHWGGGTVHSSHTSVYSHGPSSAGTIIPYKHAVLFLPRPVTVRDVG